MYFWRKWTVDPLWPLGLAGLLLGVALFYFVIPGIKWFEKNKWFGLVKEAEWQPNQPIPDWAKERQPNTPSAGVQTEQRATKFGN
ncbi:MAG: hypothetical protein R3C14_30385 [Caldilineaceae bacterium]